MRAPSFDGVARFYQAAEYLTMGGALQRARVEHLARLVDARSVLVLGEGDGRFLRELLLLNSRCQVIAVDSSPVMARIAGQRVGAHAPRVRFITEDALSFLSQCAGEPKVDAVVTLFFLDCFELADVATLVQQLAGRLGPGGLWLYADFSWPTSFAARLLSGFWLRLLYLVFRALTGIRARYLVDPTPLMQANSLTLEACQTSLGGALVSTAWSKRH